MTKSKRSKEEKASSLIVSRVQREAAEGTIPTKNVVIRSRVLHGDDAVAAATAAPTAKRSRSSSGRKAKSKRTHVPTSEPSTET